VERFNRHRGAADARRVLRNADQGHSLVFFPEGTFPRTPGLLKFHTGAFATAVRAGCPLVPAAVSGTRRALPPSGGLPRPGAIELQILPALPPPDTEGDQAAAAVLLRERARTAILTALGEHVATTGGAALQARQCRGRGRRVALLEGAHRRDLILLLLVRGADEVRPLVLRLGVGRGEEGVDAHDRQRAIVLLGLVEKRLFLDLAALIHGLHGPQHATALRQRLELAVHRLLDHV